MPDPSPSHSTAAKASLQKTANRAVVGIMPEIADHLPKTLRTLQELLAKTDAQHLHKVDIGIEQAIMKAWVAVHGTGQRRANR
jgi:hypothetical protein